MTCQAMVWPLAADRIEIADWSCSSGRGRRRVRVDQSGIAASAVFDHNTNAWLMQQTAVMVTLVGDGRS